LFAFSIPLWSVYAGILFKNVSGDKAFVTFWLCLLLIFFVAYFVGTMSESFQDIFNGHSDSLKLLAKKLEEIVLDLE
jgi:hypothetical protein